MKSDEDEPYIKILALEEIYNFEVHAFFCLKSFGARKFYLMLSYFEIQYF